MGKELRAGMTRKFQIRLHVVLMLISIVVLVGVVSYVLFAGRQGVFDGSKDSAHVIKGQVRMKRTSCGMESLQKDGAIKQGAGICDAGNSLTVGELSVSTGGGALTGKHERVSDITAIHAGDYVEIRYVQDESGLASTNCDSCYVKK